MNCEDSHKIDVIVALGQAALGAVQQGQSAPVDLAFMQQATASIHAAAEARRLRAATDGPRSPGDAVPQGTTRLYANGRDVCDREDRAQAAMKKRFGRRSGS
jgi:hypothetical protein